MDIFKQQIEIIKYSNYKFNNPSEFEKMFSTPKIKKEPKYKEKIMHHIHDNNCIIKCLIARLGIALRGFQSASITPL